MTKEGEDIPNQIAEIVKKHHKETTLNEDCLKEIENLLRNFCSYIREKNAPGRASP